MKTKEVIQHNTEVSIHELLNHYTHWLVKRGYTDTDPTCEEPLAVDEYLKENPPANFLKEYADWKIKEWLQCEKHSDNLCGGCKDCNKYQKFISNKDKK